MSVVTRSSPVLASHWQPGESVSLLPKGKKIPVTLTYCLEWMPVGSTCNTSSLDGGLRYRQDLQLLESEMAEPM